MPNGPGAGRLQELGARLGIDLDPEAAAFFAEQIDATLRTYYRAPGRACRTSSRRCATRDQPAIRPAPEDNPFNAWYWRTEIHGAAGGAARRPDHRGEGQRRRRRGADDERSVDPRRVRPRVRRHGRRPRARRRRDDPRASRTASTSATRAAATPTRSGQTHNPWRHGYSTGGSSSGSAALVAGGIVDIAIGGDQGGSVRVPSSFCGLYGMKPTYGLVPYTGAMVVEPMLDHLGPMTSSVDGQRRCCST